MKKDGFTLIELLIVIGIVAVISSVVIIVINPSQLLMQARDSKRVADLATVNSALGVYDAMGGAALGSANIIYVSIPDPSATSSAGDQCQGLGLPAAPSGTTYFCAATSSAKNVDGTGWIPVNFSSFPTGQPFGALPQDPLNTTSSGNYYTYVANGSQYLLTALPESSKTKSSLGVNPLIPNYPEVIADGSNVAMSPLFSSNGLVGYWNFDEGSGTTTFDGSGNINNGSWIGNLINGGHYTSGKVGAYAGNFDGSSDYVNVPNATTLDPTNAASLFLWVNPSAWNIAWQAVISKRSNGGAYPGWVIAANNNSSNITGQGSNGSSFYTYTLKNSSPLNNWQYMGFTYDGTNFNTYYNGALVSSYAVTAFVSSTNPMWIGNDSATGGRYFNGYLDDVRMYNRALTASEISALYNSQK